MRMLTTIFVRDEASWMGLSFCRCIFMFLQAHLQFVSALQVELRARPTTTSCWVQNILSHCDVDIFKMMTVLISGIIPTQYLIDVYEQLATSKSIVLYV